MAIGIEDLTMGELAQLEEVTGISLTEMVDASKPKAKVMTGLAWLVKSRTEPTFTFNEAEAMTMSQIGKITNGDDEEAD